MKLLPSYINGRERELYKETEDGQEVFYYEDKNIINISDDIFKAKYLSDITFSSNDYALNTLLTASFVPAFLILSTDFLINSLAFSKSGRTYSYCENVVK